jgi:hypothetical protein
MIEDMSVRGFTEKTQHDSIRYVKTFAAFLSRSPTGIKPSCGAPGLNLTP